MEQNEILNAAKNQADGAAMLEVGTWIGRHQALALLANKCSAADAECLREIRDKRHYKALGLTWEEFCSRYAGLDAKTAERVMERLEEFGEAYFNLSQIIPIQPASYRALAPNVTGNTIEVDAGRSPLRRNTRLRSSRPYASCGAGSSASSRRPVPPSRRYRSGWTSATLSSPAPSGAASAIPSARC
jgi:hypothetical protein